MVAESIVIGMAVIISAAIIRTGLIRAGDRLSSSIRSVSSDFLKKLEHITGREDAAGYSKIGKTSPELLNDLLIKRLKEDE